MCVEKASRYPTSCFFRLVSPGWIPKPFSYTATAEKRQSPSLGTSLTIKVLSWAREFKVTSYVKTIYHTSFVVKNNFVLKKLCNISTWDLSIL